MPKHVFRGSADDFQIMFRNVRGKWANGSSVTFRALDGGVVNWWPSTGTVNFQGKEPSRSRLQAMFTNAHERPIKAPVVKKPTVDLDRFIGSHFDV